MYKATKNFNQYMTYQFDKINFKNCDRNDLTLLPEAKYSNSIKHVSFNGTLKEDSDILANKILD